MLFLVMMYLVIQLEEGLDLITFGDSRSSTFFSYEF